MLDKKTMIKIKELLGEYPKIKLAYFFGSRANNKFNDNSDYDFAIYFDRETEIKMFNVRIKLMMQLASLLKNDKIDVVVLNQSTDPTLNYEIIQTGKLIYDKDPFRVIVEPKILNEYFDYCIGLKKYNLTK
jgi:predicted nucleotidyltransferase